MEAAAAVVYDECWWAFSRISNNRWGCIGARLVASSNKSRTLTQEVDKDFTKQRKPQTGNTNQANTSVFTTSCSPWNTWHSFDIFHYLTRLFQDGLGTIDVLMVGLCRQRRRRPRFESTSTLSTQHALSGSQTNQHTQWFEPQNIPERVCALLCPPKMSHRDEP